MTALSNISILIFNYFDDAQASAIKIRLKMKNLKVNPALSIQEIKIPNTSFSAYIIDDFLLNTESVIHFTKNIAYFNPMHSDNSYYPGIRDNMPQPYLRLLQDFFNHNIVPKNVSNKNYTGIVHKSLISLITCSPANLSTQQKMPHVDSCKNNEFAFIHYLSGEELGGTSIYKYIPMNKVQLTENDEGVFLEMYNAVKKKPEEHTGYLNKSTSLFEQVLNLDAKFNRLVIFPGNLLHGANLKSEESYCGDLNDGRFSITSFGSIINPTKNNQNNN